MTSVRSSVKQEGALCPYTRAPEAQASLCRGLVQRSVPSPRGLRRAVSEPCSSLFLLLAQGRCSANTRGALPGDTPAPPAASRRDLHGLLSFRAPSAFQKAWRATMPSKTPVPGRSSTPSSTTTTWPSRASRAPSRPGCPFCRKRSCRSRRRKPPTSQPSETGSFLTMCHSKVTKGLGGTFRQI